MAYYMHAQPCSLEGYTHVMGHGLMESLTTVRVSGEVEE